MKSKLYVFVNILGLAAIMPSCTKKNDYSINVDVVKEWKFDLSSYNQNYATPSATETTAAFHMVALADSSIRYDVQVDSSSDRIVSAQIRLGDPISEGALIADLPIRIYSTYASGLLTGLRGGLLDTLLNNNIEKYITVTSDRAPLGLVRGQLNSTLVLSKNVKLTGASVVPSVTTTTTGTAFLRLTSDNILYSKVVVNNNDPADPVKTASINQGAASANGTAVLTLASSPAEFGVGKKSTVSSSVSSTLLNSSTYVVATSTLKPSGKIRGQVK